MKISRFQSLTSYKTQGVYGTLFSLLDSLMFQLLILYISHNVPNRSNMQSILRFSLSIESDTLFSLSEYAKKHFFMKYLICSDLKSPISCVAFQSSLYMTLSSEKISSAKILPHLVHVKIVFFDEAGNRVYFPISQISFA